MRFIPARAGNGQRHASAEAADPVHPRACGERLDWPLSSLTYTGSSPHVRGTVLDRHAEQQTVRFIPARAGNGFFPSGIARNDTVHPRACGERDREAQRQPDDTGSSPRVRGTDAIRAAPQVCGRFIPARAGNGS